MEHTINNIHLGAVTLFTAFLGAWSAFRLDNWARTRRTLNERVSALNRAIFILSRQYGLMYTLKTQVVDPVREDPARF